MESLLLGVNIIFPIFFVLIIGYFAKERGYINENFIDKGTWLVFYVALPLKLFYDVKNADINFINIKYVFYILGGVSFIFFATWIVSLFFIKDKKKLSAFVHCAYRSNFVYVGFPILEYIYEKPSLENIIIVMVFGLTLYNILAILILTYYSERENKRVNPIDIFKNILKNPMIIGILSGSLMNFLKIPLYSGINDGILLISKLSTPMSLILIGASLNFHSIKSDAPLIIGSALIKDAISPLIMVTVGILLGLTNEEIGVAYVFWATPCAVNCFIFTRQMGSDYELASKIITASFAMGVLTFPIGIGILHNMGIF